LAFIGIIGALRCIRLIPATPEQLPVLTTWLAALHIAQRGDHPAIAVRSV